MKSKKTYITKKEFLEHVLECYRRREESAQNFPPKGYAKWGHETVQGRRFALIRRLENGGDPSNHEVAAYFGKGTRCK